MLGAAGCLNPEAGLPDWAGAPGAGWANRAAAAVAEPGLRCSATEAQEEPGLEDSAGHWLAGTRCGPEGLAADTSGSLPLCRLEACAYSVLSGCMIQDLGCGCHRCHRGTGMTSDAGLPPLLLHCWLQWAAPAAAHSKQPCTKRGGSNSPPVPRPWRTHRPRQARAGWQRWAAWATRPLCARLGAVEALLPAVEPARGLHWLLRAPPMRWHWTALVQAAGAGDAQRQGMLGVEGSVAEAQTGCRGCMLCGAAGLRYFAARCQSKGQCGAVCVSHVCALIQARH